MEHSRETILKHVLVLLHQLGGRRLREGADMLAGADHGVTGWDSIELLEELEQAYGVDLRSFVEARATTRRGWFRTYTISGDATAREIADYIASSLLSSPQ